MARHNNVKIYKRGKTTMNYAKKSRHFYYHAYLFDKIR